MDSALAIQRAEAIIRESGDVKPDSLRLANLLDFLDLTAETIKLWPAKRKDSEPDLLDLVRSLSELRDDGEKLVKADPAILYVPQHNVALEFHQSLAQIRYFFGGNRISKTQSAALDNDWILTGRHPYRRQGKPGSVFVVGTDYEHYQLTFEKKYLIGEPDNPLSPLFPEGGKWLHHYDKKHHVLYIACPACADKGKPGSCAHLQTLSLHSDKSDALGLAGGQYAQGHFDEPVKKAYFTEAKQRLKTVTESSLIQTETPVNGQAWWTYQVLYKMGIKGATGENFLEDEGRQVVSLHSIDQFSAGLTPIGAILGDMRSMEDHEIQCRIFGRHVNADQNSIFDLVALAGMVGELEDGESGELVFKGESHKHKLEALLANPPADGLELHFLPLPGGPLTVFEPPKPGEQYVVGCDCAEGLAGGDLDVASVLKMTPVGEDIALEQVAVFEAAIDTRKYGDALFRLGAWYNGADLVIENNSYGAAVILHLFEALNCDFLFRDQQNVTGVTANPASQYGINTNVRSKKMLVSVLQSIIKSRRFDGPKLLSIRSKVSHDQLQSYIQQKNQLGTGWSLKGAGNSKDDHVTALFVASYAATTQSLYNYERRLEFEEERRKLGQDERTRGVWDQIRKEEEGQTSPENIY